MKKILTICFLLFAFNVNAMEKETTFKKELFDKAQSEGKVVVVSSWIKYCMSCASQMKVLDKAKNDFDNIYVSLSKKYDLSYIQFLLEGVALNPDLNLDDGMHPNEKGVKIISNSILEKIKKLN